MAKLGIEISIDITKIEKSRIYEGKSGKKYYRMTSFIDTENPGKYGDHGFVTAKKTKEESEAKATLPIIGNTKVFWSDSVDVQRQAAPTSEEAFIEDLESDIPF